MQTFGSVLEQNKGIGPGFDFLRVALSIGVLGWHSVKITTGTLANTDNSAVWLIGYSILPMFFALSGFLVAGSALRLSMKDFYINRGLRIVPALAVEIFLSALLLGPILTSFALSDYFTGGEFYRYFLNIVGYVHFRLPGLFLDNPNSGIVNQSLWTVPYELLCYITMSLIIGLGLIKRPATVVFLGLGILIAAAIIQATGYGTGSGSVWESLKGGVIRRFFLDQGAKLVPSFVIGCAFYLFRQKIPFSRNVFIALFMLTLATGFLGDAAWRSQALFHILALPVLAYLTMYIGLTNIPPLPVYKNGDYSYGIYLYGYPLQQTLMQLFPSIDVWWMNLLVTIPLVTLFAMGSWHLVEKPILKWRKNKTLMARKIEGVEVGIVPGALMPSQLALPVQLASNGNADDAAR